jgi:hypothetical protein
MMQLSRLQVHFRIILVALVVCCSSMQAQFQAQHGWDKPRLLITGDYGEGIVLDGERGVIWLAQADGLAHMGLDGRTARLSIPQRGVRRLVGQSGPLGTALIWTQIDPLNTDTIWSAWNKKTAPLVQGVPVLEYAVSVDDQGAIFVYVTLENGTTTVYLREWGKPSRAIYRTPLNLGALTLERTPSGVSLLFAEGYRITRDRTNGVTEEKFDAVLLEVKPGGTKRTVLGPAVFRDRRQRFVLYRDQAGLIPVWAGETRTEQRAAMMTGVHNPRLVYLQNAQIKPFAGDARLIGQLGNELMFVDGSSIYGYALGQEAHQLLLSPTTIDRVSLSNTKDARVAVWSTVTPNDQTNVYLSDTRRAFEPGLLDRISVNLGWNPWYAVQTALAQMVLALAFGFVSSVFCLPLMWLFSSAFGRNPWRACLVAAWVVVFGAYVLVQRLAQAAPDVPFAPLFGSPVWLVLAYLGVVTALVQLVRLRWRSRFEPLVGGLFIVFVVVALLTFGRAGFLHLT